MPDREQPLVSIIVPVYNAKNHIARCIESIRAQTWRNIQIIVLNDGSRDVSLPVCEMFRKVDSRILLVDKANSGVSDTRNLGLKLAQGEYIQFVDSDDYIDPDYTQNLVQAAEAHQADLVIAPYKMVVPPAAGHGRRLQDKLASLLAQDGAAPQPEEEPEVRVYSFLPPGLMDTEGFALHLMDQPASYYYGVLWNKLYRRSIVEAGHLRCDTGVSWCEDFLFNLEYLRRARLIAACARPVYCYVKRPGSLVATQATPARTVEMKRTVFAAYKQLYQALDLYEEKKLQVYGYLISAARDGGSVSLRRPRRRQQRKLKESFMSRSQSVHQRLQKEE